MLLQRVNSEVTVIGAGARTLKAGDVGFCNGRFKSIMDGVEVGGCEPPVEWPWSNEGEIRTVIVTGPDIRWIPLEAVSSDHVAGLQCPFHGANEWVEMNAGGERTVGLDSREPRFNHESSAEGFDREAFEMFEDRLRTNEVWVVADAVFKGAVVGGPGRPTLRSQDAGD